MQQSCTSASWPPRPRDTVSGSPVVPVALALVMSRDSGSPVARRHVVSGQPLHREDLAIWRLGLAIARSRDPFARWGVGDPYRTAEKDAEIEAAWAAYRDQRHGRASSEQQDTLRRFLIVGLELRGE